MENQQRVAGIVEAIVLTVAIAFSAVYFIFGLYRSSNILDVVLVVLWMIVAITTFTIFHLRSIVREEMVRRFFLSDEWVYNYEIGYAPLREVLHNGSSYEFVTFAADALARMSYGFEIAVTPEKFKPKLLISTRKFKFHFLEGDTGENVSGVVIDEWKGTLQSIRYLEDGSRAYKEIGSYSNAKELSHLLEDAGVTF